MRLCFRYGFLLGLFFIGFTTSAQVEEEDEYVTDPEVAQQRKKSNSDSTAQKQNPPRKIFFGGDFGGAFGEFTFVNISPRIGYRINDKTIIGVGIRYNYLRWRRRDNFNQIDPRLTIQENWIGGGLFFQRIFNIEALNLPVQPFVGFEPEILQIIRSKPQEFSITAPFILLGGGIIQTSDFGMITLGAYYNLTHESFPLTPSPIIIRMGFGF